MPTFPRGFANHEAHIQNAQMLERLAREQGADLRTERVERQMFNMAAADSRTLRGIPAIGRGVMGVIRGTNPEHAVSRDW